MSASDNAAKRGTLAMPSLTAPRWAWALLLVASVPAHAVLSGGAYALAKAEAWSNGLPVLALDGAWSQGYRPCDCRQRAYATARLEWGAQMGWGDDPAASLWHIGALTRVEASADVSGDAAQIIYHYQSRTDPSEPGRYNADARVRHWKGRGLTIGTPAFKFGAYSLGLSWDHLRLSRLRSLETRGEAGYNADDSYSYQLHLRDDDSDAHRRFMAPAASEGAGDAVSLSFRWQGAPEAAGTGVPAWVTVSLDDAWSRLRWRGVNGDEADIDSRVATRTPEGYIEYQAALQGQYTRRTLEERIPVTVRMAAGWRALGQEWSLRLQHRAGLWQRWVGWQSPGAVNWRLGVEPLHHAFEVGVGWGGLNASFMADRLDDGAHAQAANLSWAFAF
jgi:hypothetical protein